jgi:hypothetical protein
MTVHIGARVVELAEAGEILVTKTVVDLVVGSGLQFGDRGEHQLKGVPGSWRLFRASGHSDADRRPAEPASKYMTSADRLTIQLARRAPGVMRALGRLGQRTTR